MNLCERGELRVRFLRQHFKREGTRDEGMPVGIILRVPPKRE